MQCSDDRRVKTIEQSWRFGTVLSRSAHFLFNWLHFDFFISDSPSALFANRWMRRTYRIGIAKWLFMQTAFFFLLLSSFRHNTIILAISLSTNERTDRSGKHLPFCNDPSIEYRKWIVFSALPSIVGDVVVWQTDKPRKVYCVCLLKKVKSIFDRPENQ